MLPSIYFVLLQSGGYHDYLCTYTPEYRLKASFYVFVLITSSLLPQIPRFHALNVHKDHFPVVCNSKKHPDRCFSYYVSVLSKISFILWTPKPLLSVRFITSVYLEILTVFSRLNTILFMNGEGIKNPDSHFSPTRTVLYFPLLYMPNKTELPFSTFRFHLLRYPFPGNQKIFLICRSSCPKRLF